MKTLIELLEQIACESYPFHRKTISLVDPKWEETGKVHDWRNHVPKELVENWDQFSAETRLVIYIMASKSAWAEEWD